VEKRDIVAEKASATGRGPRALLGARFLFAAASLDQLPAPGPPVVAFAGRSNAGKSSAINALAMRNRLAFASRTPGRTQQIVLFELPGGALVADLPGYGYAAVPKALKEAWQQTLATYVATRPTLVGLVLVVDARHGLRPLDTVLLDGFVPSGREVVVLATKSDKLSRQEAARAAATLRRELAERYPAHAPRITVIPFSASARTGVDDADAILARWVGRERRASDSG
jgi:GTP-binding protein